MWVICKKVIYLLFIETEQEFAYTIRIVNPEYLVVWILFIKEKFGFHCLNDKNRGFVMNPSDPYYSARIAACASGTLTELIYKFSRNPVLHLLQVTKRAIAATRAEMEAATAPILAQSKGLRSSGFVSGKFSHAVSAGHRPPNRPRERRLD